MAVYVVLRRGEHVLFLLRRGTGYRDGELGLPAGKVEPHEMIVEAAVREAHEEVGITVATDALSVAHVMERITPTGQWIDWFLVADSWHGEPTNLEPEKCAALEWRSTSDPRVGDYVRTALTAIAAGSPFSTYHGH